MTPTASIEKTASAPTQTIDNRPPTPVIQPASRGGGAASRILMIGLIAVVVGVGGFVGGMQYQKGKAGTNATGLAASGMQAGFAGGQGRMAMNGSFGTVTAVDSANVTVKDQQTGTAKTYSISSSTTVTDNGSTASITDISVGDSVMVQTDSSTSTAATAIVLNAQMGGPGNNSSTI